MKKAEASVLNSLVERWASEIRPRIDADATIFLDTSTSTEVFSASRRTYLSMYWTVFKVNASACMTAVMTTYQYRSRREVVGYANPPSGRRASIR